VAVAGAQGLRRTALQRSDGSSLAEILESKKLGFDVPEIGRNDALSKICRAPDKPETTKGDR